jgi:NAD(P)-dependent dehydrogenase (short-subunit alcohol dehydrogenase family)
MPVSHLREDLKSPVLLLRSLPFDHFLKRTVAPGSILTPLLQKAREANPEEGSNIPTAIKRLGTAEEMASIITFLLGPESTYVTGSVYGGDGGWNC